MGLVSIHSFLIKRMTAVAEEIFDAVKNDIVQYEQEIERLKLENSSLRNTLNPSRASIPADTRQAQSNVHDTQTSRDEILQGPELSEIQVKMEVATVLSQEHIFHTSTTTSPDSEECTLQETHLPNVLLKNEDNGGTDTQLSITVKSELCDYQTTLSNSSAVQFGSDDQADFSVPEQDQPPIRLYNETTNEMSKKGIQSHQNLLICRFCRRTFRTKGRLQKHVLVHKNDVVFFSGSSGSRFKSKFQEHGKLHAEGQVEEQTEDTQDSQLSHVEISLQPDNVNVDTNLLNSTGLSVCNQGSGKYPFYCKICDRPFRRQKSMKNHMLLHQSGRNYPCEFCGRRFYKSWHLAEHLRIHTGEKPFGCDECGRRFVQWNQARSHIIKHHEGDMSLLSKK